MIEDFTWIGALKYIRMNPEKQIASLLLLFFPIETFRAFFLLFTRGPLKPLNES
jgi:hypothetical protein